MAFAVYEKLPVSPVKIISCNFFQLFKRLVYGIFFLMKCNKVSNF